MTPRLNLAKLPTDMFWKPTAFPADQACGKCVPAQCPNGYSTDIVSCESGYTLTTSGKSGGQVCGKCDCKLTSRECPTAYEATLSCQKDGLTYYKCELCHREGGSAEGLYYCYNNDGKPSYGFTRYRMFLLFVAVKTTEPPAGVKRPDFSIVLISEQQAAVMSAKFAENAAIAVIMLITKAGFTEAISQMHATRMAEL